MSSTTYPTTNTTSNYTQPSYCNYSDGVFPSLHDPPKYYAEVPLYQAVQPHANKSEILQSCCPSEIWLLSDPKPCTAVCNMTSEKQAQDLSDCMDAQHIDYGGHLESAATGIRESIPSGIWTTLFVGGLVISGMML